MGIVAILVSRPFEQIFNLPLPGSLTEIALAVSKEKLTMQQLTAVYTISSPGILALVS